MNLFKNFFLLLLALFIGMEFSLINVQASTQWGSLEKYLQDMEEEIEEEERDRNFIYIPHNDMYHRKDLIALQIEDNSSGVVRNVYNVSFDESTGLLTFSGIVRNNFYREISCSVSETWGLRFGLRGCLARGSSYFIDFNGRREIEVGGYSRGVY